MNMQMEDFYAQAKDADILIYNSTIEGELDSVDTLLAKSPLFADFKAVKEGKVYCTTADFFQETTGIASFIEDLHAVMTGDTSHELKYLKEVK
jgi:iron complex transport system substrate-binding protein